MLIQQDNIMMMGKKQLASLPATSSTQSSIGSWQLPLWQRALPTKNLRCTTTQATRASSTVLHVIGSASASCHAKTVDSSAPLTAAAAPA